MRRHDLDWISFIAGSVFAVIAVIYLVAEAAGRSFDGRLVWPVVLLALGAAGVATAVKANQREERQYPRVPAESSTARTDDLGLG